jgi:hypothetical protein
MAFRISNKQARQRDALAAALRAKAAELNSAVVAFNRGVGPLTQSLNETLNGYNMALQIARSFTNGIADAAQAEFDVKAERWKDSDKGVRARDWIERWQINLDDVELALPEPLDELDPEEHAGEIEDAPRSLMELAQIIR